jgi:hypothetical protein
MPSLGEAEWLNSEPLSPAGLRGHVVLVNFWTLTCINWLRQEPYVRAWSQAYRVRRLGVTQPHSALQMIQWGAPLFAAALMPHEPWEFSATNLTAAALAAARPPEARSAG